jgi:hypothetical protein
LNGRRELVRLVFGEGSLASSLYVCPKYGGNTALEAIFWCRKWDWFIVY